MAEPRLAAAAPAQLHDRSARRALRVRRAGSCRPRALPGGARPRHADRDTGSAPVISISRTVRTLPVFPCCQGKNCFGSHVYAKNITDMRYLHITSDVLETA